MFSFIDQILNWLIGAIGDQGPLAIFLGGLIEQVIIPLPSPLIAMAGGFLLIPQELTFLKVCQEVFLKITLPYTLAAILGLGIVYFIAYFGGKPLIDKFSRWLGFSWKEIENLQKKFSGSRKDEL